MKFSGLKRTGGVLLGLTALLNAGAAMAQDRNAPYDRGNNQGVRDRPRPEYETAGMPAGGFRFFPSITASAESNDNVFADAADEISDTIARLAGSARFSSIWSRHAFNVTAAAATDKYSDNSQNDTSSYSLGADARLDVTRAVRIDGALSYGSAFEARGVNDPRTAGGASRLVDPIEYETKAGSLGVTAELNRVRVALDADASQVDFDNGRLSSGAVFAQDFRDVDAADITARVDFALSPDTALFVSGSQGWRSYDVKDPAFGGNRDFEVTQALAGASFDITRLLRGEIGVGYSWATFDDAATYPEANGLSVSGKVDWFPTQLTTVALSAARNIEEAGVAGVGSITRADYGVRVDHELRRNIVLIGEGRFIRDEYNETNAAPTVAQREDDRTQYTAGIDWLLNRVATINGRYTRAEQDSNDAVVTGQDRSYEQNIAWIGLTLRR